MKAYVAYFENLEREQQTLEELYAPVSDRLTSESASAQERALEFSIRWEADLENWLARGSALFDQRRAIPYRTFDALTEAANRILMPAWVSGNSVLIEPAMEEFLTEFRNPDMPPSTFLRTGITYQDTLEWLTRSNMYV